MHDIYVGFDTKLMALQGITLVNPKTAEGGEGGGGGGGRGAQFEHAWRS